MSIRDWFRRSDNDAPTAPDEWGAPLIVAEGTHIIDEDSHVSINMENESVPQFLRQRFEELERFEQMKDLRGSPR